MQRTLTATLRAVLALALPATVGLLVLGGPLVGLLFERGAFEASSTEMVTWALSFFALGLVGHAGLEIVARAFYALHDTVTPVVVGGGSMLLNLGLSLVLPAAFAHAGGPPHAGLALANSAATLLELVVLMVLVRQRLGGLQGVPAGFARAGLAALAMGGVLLAWRAVVPASAGSLLIGGGGVALGAATYLGAALLLRVGEVQEVTARVWRRGRAVLSYRAGLDSVGAHRQSNAPGGVSPDSIQRS
jgi:putative peptidoglycan lipid II flippase